MFHGGSIMGRLSVDALEAGQQLGLASYYISIHDSNAASAAITQAADALHQLSSIVGINIGPGGIHSEQDIINLREAVGAALDKANKVLHAAYQLGLHLGVAMGESSVPAATWTNAVTLIKRGIKEAQDDLRDPALNFLGGTPYAATLSKISAEINPQHKTTAPWEDLNGVFTQIRASLASAPQPPP
jgi:hypothetical protein